MTDLLFMYNNYLVYANMISNWKELSITDLANGYIKAEEDEDEDLRNSYISALMCRYWYMIPYLYSRNKSVRLDICDFASWIYDALCLGLKYRRWRDSSYDVSKSTDGAKVVFNRCISTIKERFYQISNRSNNKVNYETCSLDELYSSIGDSLYNNLATEEVYEEENLCDKIISYYVKKKDLLSALLVYGVGYENPFNKSNNEFNRGKLQKFMESLSDDDVKAFGSRYSVPDNLIDGFIRYKNSCIRWSYREAIAFSLKNIKTDKGVKNIVCC